jgi:hypothetical protein
MQRKGRREAAFLFDAVPTLCVRGAIVLASVYRHQPSGHRADRRGSHSHAPNWQSARPLGHYHEARATRPILAICLFRLCCLGALRRGRDMGHRFVALGTPVFATPALACKIREIGCAFRVASSPEQPERVLLGGSSFRRPAFLRPGGPETFPKCQTVVARARRLFCGVRLASPSRTRRARSPANAVVCASRAPDCKASA